MTIANVFPAPTLVKDYSKPFNTCFSFIPHNKFESASINLSIKAPDQFPGQEDPLRRDRLPTPVILGFPKDSYGKEPTCNAGDLGSIPRLGISYKVQYSCQENSMERGA